jgi:hypothetical protein
MRKIAWSVLAAALALAAPTAARAGVVLELSAGSGATVDPSPASRIPTNVMLAGGFSFASLLKLELGTVANFGDVKSSKFNMDLRPMAVVSPPLFPLYLRGILTVTNLVRDSVKIGYGGGLGASFGVAGVGAFLEADALSRIVEVPTVTGGTRDKTTWTAEGRLGVRWD